MKFPWEDLSKTDYRITRKIRSLKMLSVIIPMFNSEETIVKSLDSVKNQTYRDGFEIIVVNDGSTDYSLNIVENYIQQNPNLNVILVNQQNGGVSKARNVGLQIAKGEYIALLDSDDVWLPQKTERQMKIFSEFPEIDFLASMRTNQKILFPYFLNKDNIAEITFRKLMLRNEASTPSVIFKRKIIEEGLFFDEFQKYAEDHNFWLRISLKFKMAILGEKLVLAGDEKRTFGVSGLSANLDEMGRGFQKNLREMQRLNKINGVELKLYSAFYKMKYFFGKFRNFIKK